MSWSTVPHLVARREDHSLLLRGHLPALGIDVSDTSDVGDLYLLSVRDVTELELPESAAECKLSLAIQRLVTNQYDQELPSSI